MCTEVNVVFFLIGRKRPPNQYATSQCDSTNVHTLLLGQAMGIHLNNNDIIMSTIILAIVLVALIAMTISFVVSARKKKKEASKISGYGGSSDLSLSSLDLKLSTPMANIGLFSSSSQSSVYFDVGKKDELERDFYFGPAPVSSTPSPIQRTFKSSSDSTANGDDCHPSHDDVYNNNVASPFANRMSPLTSIDGPLNSSETPWYYDQKKKRIQAKKPSDSTAPETANVEVAFIEKEKPLPFPQNGN